MKCARAAPRKSVVRYDQRASASRGSRRFGAPRPFSFESVVGVGRARVFRRPSRAYTLRAAWLCHASLATPETAASTPSRSLPGGPRWRRRVCAGPRVPSTSRCAFGSRRLLGVDRAHGRIALAQIG